MIEQIHLNQIKKGNEITRRNILTSFKSRYPRLVFLVLLCFICLAHSRDIFALSPVYVKDFTVGGNATHLVGGQWVPNPGVPVLLKTRSYLGVAGYRVLLSQSQIVITTDGSGHFETQVPCYLDADGGWNSQMEGEAIIIGASGGAAGFGGGLTCSQSTDQFKNYLSPYGDTTEQESQNLGGDVSCPAPSVARPVNTTNGNMWLRQRDYALPGIGENIKIDRFYNSLIQQSGLFGFGWKTDYDESVSNPNNEYVIWRGGDGRGYYFANVGNNVFASASAGFSGQVLKNTDNTYILTLKDGRSRKFGTTGKLLWLKDRNSNQTTVNYDTGGVMTGVTDAFGRTLTFTMGSNGAVSQISDTTGTVATYEYFTGTSNLKTVTYPDGSKYKFEYTDIVIGGQTKTFLTTVKDALDNILETHAYDSSGRATTSEVEGGVEKYTLDYSNWGATVPYTVVTDALGNVTKYYFDKSKGRNVITKTEGLCGCGGSGSEAATYEYDHRLNLVKKIDALSNQTIYTYDSDSNLTSITDPMGTQSFTYNALGGVLTHTDRMGGGTTNTYTSAGNLLTTTEGLYPPITWTNKVGVAEAPTGTITRNAAGDSWGGAGASSVESISGDGRLFYVVGQANKHLMFGLGYADSDQNFPDIDFAFNLNTDGTAYLYENGTYSNTAVPYTTGTVFEIERVGTTVYYKKNGVIVRTVTGVSTSALYVDTSIYSNGGVLKGINLISSTDTTYPKTAFTYTSLGQLATVMDARSKTTSLIYDSSGRLTQVTDANSKNTNFAYDSRARLTSVTNALNQTTSYEYDLNNRLKKVIHPDASFVTIAYDTAGRRTSVTDELGHATTFGYDGAYRLTTVTDALNQAKSFGYDLMSNLTSETDALGNVTNYEYDDFNRMKKIVYPVPSPSATPLQETMTYDKLGNIKTKVDTGGRTTSYDYDTASRLTKITDPLTSLTQFEYNARSQTTKVKDALNQEYTFTYDTLGRTLSQTRAGSTMSFGYDAVGNRTSRTDYNGNATSYTYDAINRLTNINYTGSSDYATYSYDDLSRLVSAVNQNGTVAFTYDNRNRLASETDAFGHVLGYTYDTTGKRTSLQLDSTAHTSYAYDNANRLTTLTDESSTNFTFAYDNANRLTSKLAPNGITSSYEYDGMSRLKRLKHYTTGSTLYDDQFTYNTASQISQIAGLSQTRSFTYDNIDRLTAVAVGGSGVETYAYDTVGNRTSSHLSASYTTGSFNRLTASASASYSYNSNGSMTGKTVGSTSWTYGWDRENRMISAGDGTDTAAYAYDALGRRVKRTQGSDVQKYAHDGNDVVLDDVNTTLTKYQNGRGIDDKLKQVTSGTSKFFLLNDLASSVGIANPGGTVTDTNSYDSFGNATNGSFPGRYAFTGRERDSLTGLQFSRARFYDPELGRFISEDPIGFGGGDINLYGYVWNNPLHFTDPMGLDGWGNHLADYLDSKITPYRGSAFDPPISFNPLTGRPMTAADIGSSLADTFRLGSGFGAAIYDDNLGPLHKAEGVIYDLLRAANVAGAGGAAASALGRGVAALRAGSPVVVVSGKACPVPAPKVHGNSLNSTRPTWGYKLNDSGDNFLKNGITSQPIAEARYTKAFMADKKIVERFMFPTRREARAWEFRQNMFNPGPLNIRR